MAFLSFVKANENTYVYLKEYTPPQDFSDKTSEIIYAFGRIDKAYMYMNHMMEHFEILFPEELKDEGFTKNDLRKWHIKVSHKLHELEQQKRVVI